MFKTMVQWLRHDTRRQTILELNTFYCKECWRTYDNWEWWLGYWNVVLKKYSVNCGNRVFFQFGYWSFCNSFHLKWIVITFSLIINRYYIWGLSFFSFRQKFGFKIRYLLSTVGHDDFRTGGIICSLFRLINQ